MANVTVMHGFSSPIADGVHTNMLQPSHWNSVHNVTIDGVVGTNFAGTNVSGTVDSSGMSLSVAAPSGGASWGGITGTLSNQTDLQAAFNNKANTSHNHQAGIERNAGTGLFPTITEGSGTFTVGSGTAWMFDDSSQTTMTLHTIAASGTLTPTDNVTEYVCADRNTDSWVLLTDSTLIDGVRYLPYFRIFKRSGSTAFHTQIIVLGAHGEVEANHQRELLAATYSRETGLDQISVDGSLNLTCNAGVVWATNNRYSGLQISAATRQFMVNRLGTATSAVGPVVNNTQYDDGTGFQTLTAGDWVINWLFIGIENQNHCYTLLSDRFSSADEARAYTAIGTIPELISSHAFFIGRVIVEQGQTVSANNIESAFAFTFSASTPITDHEKLVNLYGGDTNGHYHIASNIYSNLTAGSYQLTSGTSAITSLAFPTANTTQFAGIGTTTAATNANVTLNAGTNGIALSVSVNGGGAVDGYNSAQFTNSTANSTQPIVWAGNSNGSGNVTMGLTGSTVTMSAPAGGAGGGATVNGSTGNVSLVGFQSVTMSTNGSTISFGLRSDITTALQSAGAYLTTQSVQTQNSVLVNGNSGAITVAGTTTGSQSTAGTDVVLTMNSNGLNLGVPKYITTYVAQTVQPVAFSASGSSSNFSTLQFGNTNGVSFSISNGSVVGTVKTDYQSSNANYLTSQSIQTQNSVLVNGNSGAITVAGTTTGATGASLTVNSNGINVSVVTNYSTGYSAKAESTHSHSFGTTATAGSLLTIGAGSNGISVGMPAFITTYAAQTVDTNKVGIGNVSTVATAGSLMSGSAGTNGITLAVPAYVTNAGGGGGAAISAGTSSQNTGTVIFSNANGVTFGLDNGTITATVVPGAAAGIAAFGNSQSTYTSGTVGLLGAGAVTIASTTGNQFQMSVPAQSVLSAQTNITIGTTGSTIGFSVNPSVAMSAGTQSQDTGTVVFSNSNNVSFGLSAGTLTATVADQDVNGWSLVGNTAGTNSTLYTTHGPMYLSGGNNVTLSGNSNTIVVSAAAGGGGGTTLSHYTSPHIAIQNSYSSSGQTNASASIGFITVNNPIQFTRLEIPVQMSMATSAASNVAGVRFSNVAVLYSLNGSTLNPIVGASNTQVFSWASNTGSYSSVTGGRLLTFGIQTTLSAGEYYMGVHISSTSAIATGTANTTALNATMSMAIMSVNTTLQFEQFNAVTNNSSNVTTMGLISSAITNTAQTLQISQMTMTGAPYGRANILMLFHNN